MAIAMEMKMKMAASAGDKQRQQAKVAKKPGGPWGVAGWDE